MVATARLRDAVVDGATRLRYGELWERSGIIARGLSGLDAGDPPRVAVAVRSACALACLHVAVQRAGGGTVLLDPEWPGERLLAAAARAAADWLVVDVEFGVDRAALSLVEVRSRRRQRLALRDGADQPSLEPTLHPDRGRAPAVVLATAGTTGEPKLVEHTREGVVAAYRLVRGGFGDFLGGPREGLLRLLQMVARKPGAAVRSLRSRKVWMTSLPAHRIAGYSLLLQALLGGETFVAGDGVGAGELVGRLRSERVTVMATSPVMAEFMVRVRCDGGTGFPDLLVFGLGSDRARSGLARRLEERFGCAVVSGYGTTELGGGVLATHVSQRPTDEAGDVGMPFRGVEVRTVDDAGRPLPRGRVGRLECRVPGNLVGRVLGTTPDGAGAASGAGTGERDRWTATGDRARIDADGRVNILGRIDDLIVKGSIKVDPLEVERVLEELDVVGRAGVVGVPSSDRVTRIVAFCENADGLEQDVATLRAQCLSQLPRAHVPDQFVPVGSLPVSAEGKVRRAILRDWARDLGRRRAT